MEKLGHFGMLVGHVPPGENDCMYQWAIRLRALQDRYQNVIRFSIHGHSHLENYNLVNMCPECTDVMTEQIQQWVRVTSLVLTRR